MTLKRSWMPRPKSPMRPMSAKRLARALANGGYPSSTFLKLPHTSRLPFEASGVEGSAGGVGVGVPVRSPRPRAGISPKRRLSAVPRDTAAQLAERSAGWCEIQLPECMGRAVHPHHRITTKSGGRHGAAKVDHDRLSDLLHLCFLCHDVVTNRPARAQTYGWSLLEGQEPTRESLLYRGVPSYLDDVGGVWSLEEVGA